MPAALSCAVKTSAAGFPIQVAVRGPLHDPGRRRDLERGRLEDGGPALSGPEREGGTGMTKAGAFWGGRVWAFGVPGGGIVMRGQVPEQAGCLLEFSRGNRGLGFTAMSAARLETGHSRLVSPGVNAIRYEASLRRRFDGAERGPGLAGLAPAELRVGGFG
jgi:hypothetical protein